MRTLTLIRHAKSSWKDTTLDDFDRPLNRRGRENAPMMGHLLKKMGLGFDLIVTSPALRALTTARLIAEQLGYPEQDLLQNREIYGASTTELLEIVQRLPDEAANVALVGHNPALTEFCSYLSGEYIDNLPTCAVASIRFDVDAWQAVYRDMGRLIHYEYPRKYTG